MRIRVLAVYFGRLPDYLPLFLRSCAANPHIDWLILTDRIPRVESPANLAFIETTLANVRNRVREATGVEPCLFSAYKLCDFRPAYGLVFSDYLAGYDFWGHCDLDMLFGSLASFVTRELLERYDRLFSRGAFILYRNCPRANEFFRLTCPGIDYQHVFSSPRSFAFDEWGGMHRILQEHGIETYGGHNIADIKPNRYHLEMGNQHDREDQAFLWSRGRASAHFRQNGLARQGTF